MARPEKKRTKTRTRTRTRVRIRVRTRLTPLWRVLLHDDDVNPMDHVVRALQEVFAFPLADARAVMSEAHCTGVGLCKIEAQSEAERHRNGLASFGLTATIEKDPS